MDNLIEQEAFSKTKPELKKIEQGEKTPSELIAIAIQQGIDVDKLEKLMDLQDRWQAQKAKKSFLQAMVRFQSKCPVLEKKKKVAFKDVKYNYAELGEISQTINPIAADCGLTYRWEINDVDTKINVACIVSHIDGHAERTEMSAASDSTGSKNAIQSRASTVTYMQRYTLIGALGLTTANEDVDGQTEDKAPEKVYAEDNREWLSEANYKASVKRIQAGEDIFDKLKETYKISKKYYAGLVDAKNYKPKTVTNLEDEKPIDLPDLVKENISKCGNMQQLNELWERQNHLHSNVTFIKLVTDKKKELSKPVK